MRPVTRRDRAVRLYIVPVLPNLPSSSYACSSHTYAIIHRQRNPDLWLSSFSKPTTCVSKSYLEPSPRSQASLCTHTDQMHKMLTQWTRLVAGPAVLKGSSPIDMKDTVSHVPSFDAANAARSLVLNHKRQCKQWSWEPDTPLSSDHLIHQ